MRVLDSIRHFRATHPTAAPEAVRMLGVLERIFVLANPTEDEEDLLLDWFIGYNEEQIGTLRGLGLNRLADVQEEKLHSVPFLRRTSDSWRLLMRAGDHFLCDDRGSPNYDGTGEVLAFHRKDQTYTVRFDGWAEDQTSRVSAWSVGWDSGTENCISRYTKKWNDHPLTRLLDLGPLAAAALGERLSVFLCHGSEDKGRIRELYDDLRLDGFRPWFDSETLVPGDEWEQLIRCDIERSDVVLVCISAASINRTGFFQIEIDFALGAARTRTDGARYLIPVLLDASTVPARLEQWHAVRLHDPDGYRKLTMALTERARELGRPTG